MPDRDCFTGLTPRLRPGANALLRVARGGELDLVPVAKSLQLLLSGGVSSLHPMLKCITRLGGDNCQGLFQDDSFARLPRQAVEQIHETYGRSGRVNELLCQAAVQCCGAGRYDGEALVQRFLWSVLDDGLISSRGGVTEQLARQRVEFSPERFKEPLSPVLAAFTEHLLRHPDFNRPRLASRFIQAVDLYGENLLESAP
ncbi:hypothetical protein [Archangium primigenium]|uniref:hypothetical protein n=1 Tax=[Archangium] primigenium TaxID=2792470 RepID=UPI00195AC891|nr:hypothetical protein [Archangium primigenium]MBM7112647.1 hypothetical protein [Archangium primigenium]